MKTQSTMYPLSHVIKYISHGGVWTSVNTVILVQNAETAAKREIKVV